jgi:amino acid transporter
MENEKNIFGLSVEGLAKNHLIETSKWGKFLAIVGFIVIGFMLIAAIITLSNPSEDPFSNTASTRENTITGVVTLLFFCVLYFFPCYFLLRFSNKLKTAMAGEDAASLTEAFRNLKITFRYIGIVTLISIVFLLLTLLIGISENL